MYKKISADEIPTRGRKSESRFESTPEWAAMKSDLPKMKAKDALQITLTDADKEKVKLQSRRTIARFIVKYLADNGMNLAVKTFRKDDVDYIVVTKH